MNIKGVIQKRGVIFTSLFLSLMPFAYATTSGAFSTLAQVIRDMLYGISEILSPFVKEGLLTGSYGDVYGRALLATIMILVLMIPIKKLKLFEENQGAGMALAVIIPVAGVIVMPYNWIISIYDSWLSVLGMILGLVIVSLLKAENRTFAAIKGAIYFAFIPALSGLSQRFSFNDSLNMLISIFMIICFILFVYNMFIRSFKGVGGTLGGGVDWVKDNYDWEKEKREAKAIGKGGKWLGRKGWQGAKGTAKGIKKGYNWTKKRLNERVAKGIENINNLQEVKRSLEKINIRKDKIEEKTLNTFVNALLEKLPTIWRNEKKYVLINPSDLTEMYDPLAAELNIAIGIMNQPWLSQETKKSLEGELGPLEDYKEKINDLLKKIDGLRQRNIEQMIQQLEAYINNHNFEPAIVSCEDLIEFKKTAVFLEREFREEIKKLYDLSEKLSIILEKATEEQSKSPEKKAGPYGPESLPGHYKK